MRGDPLCVYVIGCDQGRHKIGISGDVQARMVGLRADTRQRLHLVAVFPGLSEDARAVEAKAHSLLTAKRIIGEWFDVTADEAVDAVNRAAQIIRNNPVEARQSISIRVKSSLMDRLDLMSRRTKRSKQDLVDCALDRLLDDADRAGNLTAPL